MSLVHWSPADDGGDDAGFVARAFGTGVDDLGVDLLAPLDTATGTLLQTCLSRTDGSPFTAAEVADWTVAKRRQGLLAVATATGGPRRDITATCAAPDCGEQLDLALDLMSLRRDWRHETVEAVLPDGQRLALRQPQAADLARVAGLGDGAAEATLLRQLLVGDAPAGEHWQQAADAALSEIDPLADLELQASCPACGAGVAHPLLIEPYLLAELAAASTHLLDQIHVLAFAYHWSEPEIVALPASRRQHYLARIQDAWAV